MVVSLKSQYCLLRNCMSVTSTNLALFYEYVIFGQFSYD